MSNDKVWDKAAVVSLIDSDDRALARAVLAIYKRQTDDEKTTRMTVVANGRGFNSRDAKFLSSIAQALPKYDHRFTPRQIKSVRPMMRKYWRQLLEEIEAKGLKVSYRVTESDLEAAPRDISNDESSSVSQPPKETANASYPAGSW